VCAALPRREPAELARDPLVCARHRQREIRPSWAAAPARAQAHLRTLTLAAALHCRARVARCACTAAHVQYSSLPTAARVLRPSRRSGACLISWSTDASVN
jgi:hypothetical protein